MNRALARLPQVFRQGSRKVSTNLPPGYVEANYPDLTKIKKIQATVQVDIDKPVFVKSEYDKVIFALSCFTTAVAIGCIGQGLYEVGAKYAR